MFISLQAYLEERYCIIVPVNLILFASTASVPIISDGIKWHSFTIAPTLLLT